MKQGDWNGFLKLITPTHIGVRAEAFICIGFCLGIGGNFIHNFYDKRTAISADYSGGAGPALGASFMPKIGVFASVGPLVGWASSSIMDSTSGDSLQVNGFAAAEEGVTASVNTPINLYGNGNVLNGDPYYGQSPTTIYLGYGAGIGLGVGTGISHTFARQDIKW